MHFIIPFLFALVYYFSVKVAFREGQKNTMLEILKSTAMAGDDLMREIEGEMDIKKKQNLVMQYGTRLNDVILKIAKRY